MAEERERRRGTCGAPSMSENPIPSKLIFAETSYAIVSSTDMYESKLCRSRGSSNMNNTVPDLQVQAKWYTWTRGNSREYSHP